MANSKKLRVVQCGLGPLGVMTLKRLFGRQGFELVAAVDRAPHLAGKKLAEVVEHSDTPDLTVEADLQSAIERTRPDACILMTVSDLKRIESQIEAALLGGTHVVSTCEELSFPWQRDGAIAGRLDALAKKQGKVVLGTGVNPGFLMDYLPQTLTGVCDHVDAVRVERYQDASSRRLPFQQKIGAGLTLEAFRKKQQEGTLRHVGLEESMHLIASQFGWTLDRTEDRLEPIIATQEWRGEHMTVPAGDALGVLQTGRGFRDGVEVITLVFHAAVGTPDPRDRIVISGEPAIDSTISGGVQGDVATCSIVLNACNTVQRAAPGLQHMGSIPSICWYGG